MKKPNKYIRLLATTICLILFGLFVAFVVLRTFSEREGVTYYIAPLGNDLNEGDLSHPLRSVHQAQKLAAPYYGKRSVQFIFMDGVHYLDSCIVITPRQSGTEKYPVTYMAQHEGKAVISGGKQLKLEWNKREDGICSATLLGSLSSIDQLYVNGKRKYMARYPNRNGKNVFDAWDLSHAIKPDPEADLFNPKRVALWKNPKGAYIHAMHGSLWGDMHWKVTGKEDDKLAYYGGWQNNRPSAMHPVYRMIENVFEELDEPGEWFFDELNRQLYYYPEHGESIENAKIESVILTELIRFDGSRSETIKHTHIKDLVFRHAARTFMENKEPLLRSDWTICRKGAVTYRGAEHCEMVNCEFDQVGGNAVCVNDYNQKLLFRGCYIHESGANGIAFVGNPSAVRSPLFRYGAQNYETLDRTRGPKNDLYPANCRVEECLITKTGRVEKQTAPVQISMSYGITVSHCSIYDVPRAGINFSEGTFGGHTVEYCDIFNTVLETGDHGSFNSWGRDRFFSPDINKTVGEVRKDTSLLWLDMLGVNTLCNSRWRCDHGWDIDLDDGSSHYRIYNNVLLNGGLKLREGFDRIATNNIIVNNSLHPHVWYEGSGDIVKNNIFFTEYQPIAMNVSIPEDGKWGKEIDYNFFVSNESASQSFSRNGCDKHSLSGNPMFVNAAAGDFTVKPESPVLKTGFKNFDMTFGVTLPKLRKIARTPDIPEILIAGHSGNKSMVFWHKAKIKDVETLGEQSATGLKDRCGVLVVSVPEKSELYTSGLRTNDVILEVEGHKVCNVKELLKVEADSKRGDGCTFKVWRNQEFHTLNVRFF